ncbi:MAG: hypothetical protein EDQ89_00145 [Acidobacteria bacterium]|nr:MAG: hypothetical protein EDQ89_00145 [Acidobacteriota bacterium]MCL4287592.1 hypothetical protein [Thermoleophilia bacterium]GIK78187.1 MAG: hypothetical protein BroJett022_18770 [Actinomycetes bacterium]
MEASGVAAFPARHGECRSCSTFCDKLIEPRDCLVMRCPYLWSYVDGPSGRRYMGCVQKVFRAEIDIAGFEAAERNGGFGGIKMTGEPLPQCQFRVEPAFAGDGPSHTCLNPSFFDINDPAELDLRTGLPLAG